MRDRMVGFAIVALVLVVASLILFPRHDSADVASAAGEVKHAQSAVQAAVGHAKLVDSANKVLKAKADSAESRARYAELRAQRAEDHLQDAKKAFHLAALAAPLDCGPVIEAAQKQQAVSDSVSDALASALANEKAAHSADQQRADSAEASLRDLREKAMSLNVASNKLIKASQPSFLSRLKPRMFVGTVGGVDVQGHPNAVAGFGVGWSF